MTNTPTCLAHGRAVTIHGFLHDLRRGISDQRGRPLSGATMFLAVDLGEDIKAFNYGPSAARSVVYFLMC